MWFLASIINGINTASFATGRHVYFSISPTGMVRVVGAKGATAVITLAEAKRRLRTERKDGKPVAVRSMVPDRAWQAREARRFDGVRRKVA